MLNYQCCFKIFFRILKNKFLNHLIPRFKDLSSYNIIMSTVISSLQLLINVCDNSIKLFNGSSESRQCLTQCLYSLRYQQGCLITYQHISSCIRHHGITLGNQHNQVIINQYSSNCNKLDFSFPAFLRSLKLSLLAILLTISDFLCFVFFFSKLDTIKDHQGHTKRVIPIA